MQLNQFISDFRFSRLNDDRLFDRLQIIASDLASDPGLSFPKAMAPGNLLGYYRFVGNETVEFEDVICGHVEESIRRCGEEDEVLILHDTSSMECSSVSFQAHVSLAVGRNRKPLGVLNTLLNRRGASEKKDPEAPNELLRWREAIAITKGQVANAIHVYDREADAFDLFAWQLTSSVRFVARSRWDRKLVEGNRISDALASVEVVAERTISISGRRRGTKSARDLKIHPEREERIARLAIAATKVKIVNPKSPKDFIEVNVVYVREVDAPIGVAPVQWKLLTNEPIDTVDQILRVVDIYRTRWVIEEFFKALKTGCQFEKRQHETYEAIVIALAILMPMAMQLLLLRTLSRVEEDVPAIEALTSVQIAILSKLPRTAKMPIRTIKQALLAVAALGGHLKNNGMPGWLTLGRGIETLQKYEVGWLLGMHGTEM